ncbi:RBBP6 ligase, partial [Amia calva]|nr:RBBP6 ligase [Amia calva]
MHCVHYKFSSRLTYDMVRFEGLHITLSDLKRQIMACEKLKAKRCGLQVSNAQTEEEYTDDGALIPRNSSVIIRRVPVWGVKATRNTCVLNHSKPSSGPSKAVRKKLTTLVNWILPILQISDLTEANVSEEDKISAMMFQSTHQYHPIHCFVLVFSIIKAFELCRSGQLIVNVVCLTSYVKDPEGTPPPNYTCFRCGVKGHYIRNCPTIGDPDFKPLPRIRKSAGIPRSFLVEVSDSSVKGAMLTSTGSYAIPTIAMEAYATGKKEKHPFLVQEQSSPPTEGDPVPAELLCLLCEELLVDAVVIPCCGTNYCDECIRTCLIDSDEHECPTCHKLGVSPDSLEANQVLRKVGLFLVSCTAWAVIVGLLFTPFSVLDKTLCVSPP